MERYSLGSHLTPGFIGITDREEVPSFSSNLKMITGITRPASAGFVQEIRTMMAARLYCRMEPWEGASQRSMASTAETDYELLAFLRRNKVMYVGTVSQMSRKLSLGLPF